MSSLEIAERTGKRNDHVMADISPLQMPETSDCRRFCEAVTYDRDG